jgi:hypothetical protein
MADAETPAPLLEKPLPTPGAAKRPGTSGTEYVHSFSKSATITLFPSLFLSTFPLTVHRLNLRANRRAASTAYTRAQRAEATYRAKRQATSGRADIAAAKTHFKESRVQFVAGCKRGISAVKCVPGVLQEKVGLLGRTELRE